MSVLYPLLVLVLLVVCVGRLLFEQSYGEQGCEMTYMYRWPQYLEVPLSDSVKSTYPQYGLYYYTEGNVGTNVLTQTLSGVPALFVPGNAGSHKQARSSASIALQMHPAEFPHLKHFDFFTVKFNEEFSGLFGGVLQRQAEYVSLCIGHILSLYSHLPDPPQSVVIIGHSMGGVVARSLFTLDQFNPSTVHTIIVMASPLLRPVISFDSLLEGFYQEQEVGVANMSHVTLVSVAGGKRDMMVPTVLTVVPGAINLASPAIPRNWASADHRAIVWCRRVQLALIRALFLLQDPHTHELTRDKARRDKTLTHLLLRGREIPIETTPTLKIKQSKVTMVTSMRPEGGVAYNLEGGLNKGEYVRVELTGREPIHITSNTGRSSWVFMCDHTLNCSDISSRASLLPPKVGVVKSFSVLPSEWTEESLLLVNAQPTSPKKAARKGFLHLDQCDSQEELHLSIWGTSLTLPQHHCSLTHIFLPDLQQIWQTYNATISSSCGEVRAGLYTPWYPHTYITNSTPSHYHNVILSLSLLVPTPSNHTPSLQIWSSPDCPLNIQISADPLELLDKLFILYTPLLLPWVAAVSITRHQWSLSVELLMISVLYGLTSTGLIPYSNWQQLSSSRLWAGFAPLIIHLIARGLASVLSLVSHITLTVLRKLRRVGFYLGWLVLVLSVPGVMVCSGVGATCLLIGWMLLACTNGHVHLLPLFVCLEILTIPALVSWIKGLSVEPLLSPDPHFTGILAVACVSIAMAVLPSQGHHSQSRYWEPLVAVLVLCYSTVHVYRLVGFVLVYEIAYLLEQLRS